MSIARAFGWCSIAGGFGKGIIRTIGRTKCVHAQGEARFAIRAQLQRRRREVIAILVEFLLTVVREHRFQESSPDRNQIPVPKARSRACDARMESKRAIHAAMGGILNRIRASVDVATGPRCAADLNAIEEHRAKSTLIHPDKCSCQNAAVRQGRTTGRECGHHDVIN